MSALYGPSLGVAPTRTKTHGRAACPACGGLECLCRPRFFAGQLLTEQDLNRLDRYIVEKNKLHNRYLHGWGVVCGLQVVCHECEGWVTVKQGYAIDPCGNDIIVCEDHDFNVIERIKDCVRSRQRQFDFDCEPRRSRRAECPDEEEHWCITLQYEERPSRPITALRQKPSQPCGCGNGNGHDCGCGSHGHRKPSEPRVTTTPRSRTTPAHCEPALTCEGYRLDVVPKSEIPGYLRRPELRRSLPAAPGTLAHELECCHKEGEALLKEAEQTRNRIESAMSFQQAYDACRRYRKRVCDFLNNTPLARCELRYQLNAQMCPPIPEEELNENLVDYRSRVKRETDRLEQLVAYHTKDCTCLSQLPACPPDPGDDRLILACLTVSGGKILRICHHDGRRHISGSTVRAGFGPVGGAFESTRAICCEDLALPVEWVNRAPPLRMRHNPIRDQIASLAVLMENLGASTLSATMPHMAERLFDGRPWLGIEPKVVYEVLKGRGIDFTPQDMSELPEEIAVLSERFTPTTFLVDEPLVVYTRGDSVVGFDVLDEAQRLRREVEALKDQVAELSAQTGQSPATKAEPK